MIRLSNETIISCAKRQGHVNNNHTNRSDSQGEEIDNQSVHESMLSAKSSRHCQRGNRRRKGDIEWIGR